MQEFTESVINIIRAIPSGKVMAYGDIAKWAGHPRNARRVAYILHSMTKKYDLPWHRVINSKGKISMTGEAYNTQKRLLEEEGIEFSKTDTIALRKYGHIPSPDLWVEVPDY